MNVEKGTEESTGKERNRDCRLIERPNVKSFAEKSEEHEQKIKLNCRALCQERSQTRTRVKD